MQSQEAMHIAAMPDAECSEREALAALACLRWAAPPALPPQVLECRRHAPPASTSSHSPSASACAAGTDSDCAADAECRPRKVRVLAAGAGEAVLQKRSYKWRGWRAEKQQRQLDALAAQQQHHQQEQQQRGGTSAAHSSGSTVAAAETPSAATQAAAGGSSRKEGDREFAALTTWLRMNIHNPRTAKKVVLFVGRCDAATGRWAFSLNPKLGWGDVSPETRQRLRHLPQEAAQAFAAKYPARPPADWRRKSQKYRAPGGSQTHLVLLEDLVTSLHALWLQHEGGGGAAASEGASAAAAAGAPAELASCGSSAMQPAPMAAQ